MPDLLDHHERFVSHVIAKLRSNDRHLTVNGQSAHRPASVLFLMGPDCGQVCTDRGPCIILNKRSQLVRQAGDLCFPGGGFDWRYDRLLALLLRLPGLHLWQWPHWRIFRINRPAAARYLALLLATCLRECFEEMRLNPFGVRFLGPLAPQQLRMFKADIFPLAAWLDGQKRFRLNWEVEALVYIPIKELLNPAHYACYRLRMPGQSIGTAATWQDFLCFRPPDTNGDEILWGATFRMVCHFLEMIFDFRPPAIESLPVVNGRLNRGYMQANGPGQRGQST